MKKAFVLILCFALLLTLAVGCTPQANTSTPTGGTTSATVEQTTTLGPPTEITYVFPVLTGIPVDLQMVNEAINKISEANVNVKVILNPIEVANYGTQVPLMITGGENMDLFVTLPGGPTVYATMVTNSQLKDITDLAPQYAQGIIDAFNDVNPGYLAGAYIGGRLYGFPTLFDKVSSTFFDIRKDVLDSNNLTDSFKAVKNISDLEAIIKKLSESSDIPVLCSTGNSWGQVVCTTQRLINFDNFSTTIASEFFGSDNWSYGAIIGDDNTKVINMYASDWYKTMIAKARDWYQKGYISKDAATQVDIGSMVIKANGALGIVNNGELGHQASVSSQASRDMISVKVADAIVNTGVMQKFVLGLPATCKNPEATLKFLTLMYTDPDVVNLLNYGVKDTHYVENTNGTISLPAGIDSKSAKYWQNAVFLFGNAFKAKVVAPDAADLREQALALNKNAMTAPLLGFAVNNTSFTNEYAAVINVITQYSPGLNAGSSDPATVLPQFLAALDAAGMPKIIEAVQTQVDAFVAAKK